MSTKEKLVAALREAKAPEDMISRATQGYYDDFESPIAGNIVQLVTDARAAGLRDIADRARKGDFDGTVAESEAWAARPEGRALRNELKNIPNA